MNMGNRCDHLILFGTLLSLTFIAGNTPACTCSGPRGAKTMRDVAAWYSEGSNASKIVFEGVVEKQELKIGPIGAPNDAMSMTASGRHREVSMRILRVYHGQASGTVTVLTGLGNGDCGFDFETGNQYLVYADRIDADNLFTSICTGTSPLEQAGPALRVLRGEKPTPDDLLDIQNYYDKFGAEWTGTVCGRITKSDGSSFDRASVTMMQIRNDPFPPYQAVDDNLSKPDGSFCIYNLRPGRYLLSGERLDHEEHARWMGYYPGVVKHSEAAPILVHAGDKLSDLQFNVRREPVFTLSFRIITPDGSPLPLDSLGISVDSDGHDALAYHLNQNGNRDGKYYAGYVPPGHYIVQTYVQADDETGKVPVELSRWSMAMQEVDISSATEIVLKLNLAK